jgi:hypothetical protein
MIDQSSAAHSADRRNLQEINENLDMVYGNTFGGEGMTFFRDTAVPLAAKVLKGEPRLYEQTLLSLIQMAKDNDLSDAGDIEAFWTQDITTDTFEFQKHFAQLIAPSSFAIKGAVFHGNYRKLLEKDIRNKTLIPEYMLKGESYDAKKAESNKDFYRVCFADGSVDELSVFLAGHLLYAKTTFWDSEDYKRVNNLLFPHVFSIAVAPKSKTTQRGEHDMITLYKADTSAERVDLFASDKPIQIETIPIPITALLPDQVMHLTRIGEDMYRSGEFSTGNWDGELRSAESAEYAGRVYAQSRHAELAIKYTLLQHANK